MPFLLTENPADAESVLNAVSAQFSGANKIATITDEQMRSLPFLDEIMRAASLASEIVGAGLRKRSPGEAVFGCIPIYGDGSATQLLNLANDDHRKFIVAVIDLRYALETLAHICASPLGCYSPSAEKTVAIEKLSVATRIASMRDEEIAHLALGLLSEAQEKIYTDFSSDHAARLSKLIEKSFLTGEQVSIVLQTVVCFQTFHEYGHHVTRYQQEHRDALEGNFTNYIRVLGTRLEHQIFHDRENSKLAQEMLGDEEFDLVLTSETSQEEFVRLTEARLTARQDKEEFLCDNFAVQNTAKFLVESSNLGSADWILVRYTIEYLLTTSWGVASSRPVFALACSTWNRVARGDLSEEERTAAANTLSELLADRKKLVLSQRLRLKYALEQFDTVMASLLHTVS